MQELYRRVKAHHAAPAAWKYGKPADYRSIQHSPAEDEMYFFEPHVAEKIFNDMGPSGRQSGAFVGDRLPRRLPLFHERFEALDLQEQLRGPASRRARGRKAAFSAINHE